MVEKYAAWIAVDGEPVYCCHVKQPPLKHKWLKREAKVDHSHWSQGRIYIKVHDIVIVENLPIGHRTSSTQFKYELSIGH